MTSKLTIKEESSGENMPLYYAVYDDDGRQVSMHYAREDAELMAAAPFMLEILEALQNHRINELEIDRENEFARYELTIIQVAIAAAKGE